MTTNNPCCTNRPVRCPRASRWSAPPTFAAALEIGYRAFGTSACTATAREGIDAFLQRRPADFKKTG